MYQFSYNAAEHDKRTKKPRKFMHRVVFDLKYKTPVPRKL